MAAASGCGVGKAGLDFPGLKPLALGEIDADARGYGRKRTRLMTETARELEAALNIDGNALAREPDGAVHLVGSECRDCRTRVFPPTAVCPGCMSENMAPLNLSRRGTLYSWSVVHAAPRGWKLPFVAGYVDLPEGVRVFAHIVGGDPKALRFDMPVEVTLAELGQDEQGRPLEGFAFAPAKSGEA
jgi:uncharacterized OB-fold protein